MSDHAPKADLGGGISFSRVGKVDMKAGGDIVARDKIITSTITHGIRTDSDKKVFSDQIEELKALVRDLRSLIEAAQLDPDGKDSVLEKISAQLKELNRAKAAVTSADADQPAEQRSAHVVNDSLDHAVSLVDHLKSLADKTVGLGTTLAPVLSKLEPALHAARLFLGLN